MNFQYFIASITVEISISSCTYLVNYREKRRILANYLLLASFKERNIIAYHLDFVWRAFYEKLKPHNKIENYRIICNRFLKLYCKIFNRLWFCFSSPFFHFFKEDIYQLSLPQGWKSLLTQVTILTLQFQFHQIRH